MRKSINTLAILVHEVFGMAVESGHLFLFRSRCGSKLKALYYEEFGFTLWYRRLEKGKFIFPRNTQGHIEQHARNSHYTVAPEVLMPEHCFIASLQQLKLMVSIPLII